MRLFYFFNDSGLDTLQQLHRYHASFRPCRLISTVCDQMLLLPTAVPRGLFCRLLGWQPYAIPRTTPVRLREKNLTCESGALTPVSKTFAIELIRLTSQIPQHRFR